MTDRPPHVPPHTAQPPTYKGEPLEAGRGPGLGCFWTQIAFLVLFIALAPLSVGWGWPFPVTAALFVAMLILLLFSGQTVIFLLRLVAAERRAAGRRRPLASDSPTVGELEETAAALDRDAADGDGPADPEGADGSELA